MIAETLRRRGAILLVLAMVAATFAFSVGFPFMAWDDPRYVSHNPLVVHPLALGWKALLTTVPLGYPQPVTVLSYALNRAVLGMSPWSFHLVNVAIHLVNVALVYRIALSLRLSAMASAVAAMFFGLHPLVVEPVCWVTGRKDLLAAGFVLSAIAVAVADDDARFSSMQRWCGVSALALLGIGAKPSAVVAPALIWLVAQGAHPTWSRRSMAVALTPLAAVSGLLALLGARSVVDVHPRSAADAVLDVVGAWTMQLGHLLFPIDLVTSYGRYEGDPSKLAMVLATGALIVLAVVTARADRRSPFFVGALFAAVAYGPVSGVLGVNRWSADSYMYLPLVGIAIAAVAAVDAWTPPHLRRVLALGIPALGLSLLIDSVAHASNWSSPEGPWRAAVARYPDNPVPYNELASTLSWEGRQDEAVRAFIELDERFPTVDFARVERADARVATHRTERAETLLADGIAAGDHVAAQRYWLLLVQGEIAPTPSRKDVMAASFDLVYGDMRAQIPDRAVWLRISRLLRTVGLGDDAARAEANLASLP